MGSSMVETKTVTALDVQTTDDTLSVELSDGRMISVPLAWHPRLLQGSPQERTHWRPIAGGRGVHWPDLDEDISVENLLAGQPSAESPASFKRWLQARADPNPKI